MRDLWKVELYSKLDGALTDTYYVVAREDDGEEEVKNAVAKRLVDGADPIWDIELIALNVITT